MGWTEGRPIEYQEFDGDLTNEDYPMTSLAYFRVNWRFVEPRPRQYDWGRIDRALRTATERGQSLLLRNSPYQGDDRARLAIEGRNDEGWYPMGTISVEEGPYPVGVERDLDTP